MRKEMIEFVIENKNLSTNIYGSIVNILQYCHC